MKNKSFLLILIIMTMILSGCKINYSIDYGSTIKETIELNFKEEECASEEMTCEEYVKSTAKMLEKSEGYPKYDLKINKDANNYKATFTYKYKNIKELKEKNIYLMVFNQAKINDEKIALSNFTAPTEEFDLESLNITLNTNKPVKISNANYSNKQDGIYKWSFVKEDDNQSLDMTFDTSIKNNLFSFLFNSFETIIGAIILIIIVMIIIYISYYKYKNINKV